MNYCATIEMLSRDAVDYLMRTARAMPEDKLAWKPMETGRTALDQLAECVQVPNWFARLMREKKGVFTRESIVKERAKRSEWDSMAKIEADIFSAYEDLYAAMKELTEEELDLKVEFWRGSEITLREACYYPLRNLYYHAGQINYIQTLYGDREMH